MPWSAAASVAVPVISGLFGKSSAKKQNAEAARQAQIQREWQEHMSSTAHQREVKDLRAAGLNPRLSGMGGQGAVSGSGAMAPVADEGKPAVEAASAAMNAMLNRETIKNLKETNKQISSQTLLNEAATKSALADIPIKAQTAKSVMADWKLKAYQLPAAKNDATFNIQMETAPKWMKFLNNLLGNASSAKSLVKK